MPEDQDPENQYLESRVQDQDGDDQGLMARIVQGDQRAFAHLAQRHVGRIRRLARRMLGNGADADDVAQDALVRIWSHAGQWRPERAALGTWVYTITYRLCLDRLRAHPTVPLDLALDVEDPAPAALDVLVQDDRLRRLDRVMSGLPPRQRAALTLFYYEELPGAQAAQILGLGLRAFWSLLHRARAAVQQHMEDGV